MERDREVLNRAIDTLRERLKRDERSQADVRADRRAINSNSFRQSGVRREWSEPQITALRRIWCRILVHLVRNEGEFKRPRGSPYRST